MKVQGLTMGLDVHTSSIQESLQLRFAEDLNSSSAPKFALRQMHLKTVDPP